jgi:hypothetical protein
MPKVSVPLQQIDDGSLPSVCVVCGEDAPHRLFRGVTSPSLVWVVFSPLLGLISFWIYVLVASYVSKPGSAGLPFCDGHRAYWLRRAWFIVTGFVILVGFMVASGFVDSARDSTKKEGPHWLSSVAGCWLVVYLLAFIVIHLAAIRPTRRTRTMLVLSGASRAFAARVEEKHAPRVTG